MCLGEYGTVIDVVDPARAIVRFDDGRISEVSLAVLVAEGIAVAPGAKVAVSIGMAIHLVLDDEEDGR